MLVPGPRFLIYCFAALYLCATLFNSFHIGGDRQEQSRRRESDNLPQHSLKNHTVAKSNSARVLVVGLERSGSTWQFLAVRALLAQIHGVLPASVHTHSADSVVGPNGCPPGRSPCVAKIHEFEPSLVPFFDTVLASHRDLRDVLLSVSQTFGSCLDESTAHCNLADGGDGAPLSRPQTSLAKHIQHYLDWSAISTYDMKYEKMQEDPRAEVARLVQALRTGHNGSPVDIEAAYSHMKSMFDQATSRSLQGGWDQDTGLSSSHQHQTAKPGAYMDRDLVTSLSTPSGPCNLFFEIKEIEHRYGKWLKDHEYPVESSLPDSRAGMITDIRSTEVKAPAKIDLHIRHVINYFEGIHGATTQDGQGTHDWEVDLTQRSIRTAVDTARRAGAQVSVIAATFQDEEQSARQLLGLAELCILQRKKTQYLGIPGPSLPFLQDILSCALPKDAAHDEQTVVVYTNADIGVQPDFYLKVLSIMSASLLQGDHKYSYSITRRELSSNIGRPPHNSTATDLTHFLAKAYVTKGHGHRGHDCFIMPATKVRGLDLGSLTVGYAPWGCTLLAVLQGVGVARVLTSLRLTFHFGTLPEQPNIPPSTWKSCAFGIKTGALDCQRHKMKGMCCQSCNRTPSDCDWSKAYDANRNRQTRQNWKGTIANARSSLEVLERARPDLIERCCEYASKGRRPFHRLLTHWSNKHDASGACCMLSADPFGQAAEMLNMWCGTRGRPKSRHKSSSRLGNRQMEPKHSIVLLDTDDLVSDVTTSSVGVSIVRWLAEQGHNDGQFTAVTVCILSDTYSPCNRTSPSDNRSMFNRSQNFAAYLSNAAETLSYLGLLSSQIIINDWCYSATISALEAAIISSDKGTNAKSVILTSTSLSRLEKKLEAIKSPIDNKTALGNYYLDILVKLLQGASVLVTSATDIAGTYLSISRGLSTVIIPNIAANVVNIDSSCSKFWWRDTTGTTIGLSDDHASRNSVLFMSRDDDDTAYDVAVWIMSMVFPAWAMVIDIESRQSRLPEVAELVRALKEGASRDAQKSLPHILLYGASGLTKVVQHVSTTLPDFHDGLAKVKIIKSGSRSVEDSVLKRARFLLVPSKSSLDFAIRALAAGVPVVAVESVAADLGCYDSRGCRHLTVAQGRQVAYDFAIRAFELFRRDSLQWAVQSWAGLEYIRDHHDAVSAWRAAFLLAKNVSSAPASV